MTIQGTTSPASGWRSKSLTSAIRILFLSVMAIGLLSVAFHRQGSTYLPTQTFAAVSPCIAPNPWATMDPSTFYTIPAWFLKTASVTWVQPADVLYDSKAGTSTPINDSTLAPIKNVNGATGLYCEWLLVQGGRPPYVYSGTNLPPGLTVRADGLYGGVAWKPGTYSNIIFCAMDSQGVSVCAAPRTQKVCDGGITACE